MKKMKLPSWLSQGMIVLWMLSWITAGFLVFVKYDFFSWVDKRIFIFSLFIAGQILFFIWSLKLGQKVWKKYPNERFD